MPFKSFGDWDLAVEATFEDNRIGESIGFLKSVESLKDPSKR